MIEEERKRKRKRKRRRRIDEGRKRGTKYDKWCWCLLKITNSSSSNSVVLLLVLVLLLGPATAFTPCTESNPCSLLLLPVLSSLLLSLLLSSTLSSLLSPLSLSSSYIRGRKQVRLSCGELPDDPQRDVRGNHEPLSRLAIRRRTLHTSNQSLKIEKQKKKGEERRGKEKKRERDYLTEASDTKYIPEPTNRINTYITKLFVLLLFLSCNQYMLKFAYICYFVLFLVHT